MKEGVSVAVWHEEHEHCFVIVIDEVNLVESLIDNIRQILTVAFLNNSFKIIFDFSSCKMIDSYFIGLLTNTQNDVKNLGGTLICAGVHGQIEEAFEIIHFNKVVPIYPTLEEAIASCLPRGQVPQGQFTG